jgi:hypothetical protein
METQPRTTLDFECCVIEELRPYVEKMKWRKAVSKLLIVEMEKRRGDLPAYTGEQVQIASCEGYFEPERNDIKVKIINHTFSGGGVRFGFVIGGTKTETDKMKLAMVRQNFKKFADWNSLHPFLKQQPVGITNQQPPHTYECDDCPICLEVWSDTTHQKVAMCGHSCCADCFSSVLKTNQPSCPVCRTAYKSNGTITGEMDYDSWIWKWKGQVEWWCLPYGVATDFANDNEYMRTLGKHINMTAFFKSYASTHTATHIVSNLLYKNPPCSSVELNGVTLIVWEEEE